MAQYTGLKSKAQLLWYAKCNVFGYSKSGLHNTIIVTRFL